MADEVRCFWSVDAACCTLRNAACAGHCWRSKSHGLTRIRCWNRSDIGNVCRQCQVDFCPSHAQSLYVQFRPAAESAAEPVTRHDSAALAPREAASGPDVARQINLLPQRQHSFPDLHHGSNSTSSSYTAAALAQRRGCQGAPDAPSVLPSASIEPHARSKWLPQLESDRRAAWQDTTRSTADVQVCLVLSCACSRNTVVASKCKLCPLLQCIDRENHGSHLV